jgi:hypothetical protein
MALTKNSTDINLEIFKYLRFEELLNLYKTNKMILSDIEKYSKIQYKKTFKQLYFDNKCLHCINLCDNINFRVCDNCILDTCWFCFYKSDNQNLRFVDNYDYFLKRYISSVKCIGNCIYKCYKCKKIYFDKNNIIIYKCRTICNGCNIF